jgi:hypothetical protein
MNTPRLVLLVVAVFGLSVTASAADRFFAYNLTTSSEFTGLWLAPAGTENWGPNQALSDKDHSLDVTERLPITGLGPGSFDVRLQDRKGHICVKRNVDLRHDHSFDIRDGDLAACR